MASHVSSEGRVTCSCGYDKTFSDLKEAVKKALEHDNDHIIVKEE